MKILIAGASGFIGSALQDELKRSGYEVSTLVRRAAQNICEIQWDPDRFELNPEAVQPFDAIVNLSGKNLAAGRWSGKVRQEIYESRIKPTRTLVRAIAKCGPKSLISVSGIGFYGPTRTEICNETATEGDGFIAGLADAWERETAGINGRAVSIRFGVVLGRGGGVLGKLLPVFKLGLGGKLGSGSQQMSWIALSDAVRVIQFALEKESLRGAINGVSPHPISNSTFTEALAKALGRSAPFTVPAFVLRAVFGTMAEETILGSLSATPSRLLESGFTFQCPDVDTALKHELRTIA